MKPSDVKSRKEAQRKILNQMYSNSPGMDKRDYETLIEEEEYADPTAVISNREEAEEIKEIEDVARKYTEKDWSRAVKGLSAVGALSLENLKKYMDFKNSLDKSDRPRFKSVSEEKNKEWLEKLQRLKHEHRKETIKDKMSDITPGKAGDMVLKRGGVPGKIIKKIKDIIADDLLEKGRRPSKEDIKNFSDPNRFKTGANYFISRETGDKWYFDDKKDEWHLVEKTWIGDYRDGKAKKDGGLVPVWSATDGVGKTNRGPNDFAKSELWKKYQREIEAEEERERIMKQNKKAEDAIKRELERPETWGEKEIKRKQNAKTREEKRELVLKIIN